MTGEQVRDAAFEKMDKPKYSAFRRECQRALLQAALANGTATADDVREKVEIPPHVHLNVLGTVPTELVKQKIITCTGYQKSQRPLRGVGLNRVWSVVDRQKALNWLETN